jgi:hypothetical protein
MVQHAARNQLVAALARIAGGDRSALRLRIPQRNYRATPAKPRRYGRKFTLRFGGGAPKRDVVRAIQFGNAKHSTLFIEKLPTEFSPFLGLAGAK